jgi:capping protein beta
MNRRYFEGGISSVYFWDIDDGFAGCVLLKKCEFLPFCPWTTTDSHAAVSPNSKTSGTWDSIHVFESQERARMSHYKLTSTVILNLGTDTDVLGSMDLSGNMVRQVEQDMAVEDDNSHVINIGKVLLSNGITLERIHTYELDRWLRTWS